MTESRATGCDCGTMFFQTAEIDPVLGDTGFKTIRNAFVELSQAEDIEEILNRNGWQYVKHEGKYYVIGDDCVQVANMFPGKVEIRRPMADGVLNKDEDKKMVILSEMIKSSIGDAPDNKSVVCTCVSSESVDGSLDSAFHKARLAAMFKRLGWNVKIIDEGYAVVLSQRPTVIEDGKEIPYSGIGISFGGGRTNCVLAYKGLQIVGMSCARGGDWLDKQVSIQTGIPISQVITTKEKKLDFDKIDDSDDVQFALDTYYDSLIRYVFNHFSKKFIEAKSSFNAPLDIVVAGGTSMPSGFCKKLEKVVRGLDLPFKIKEVRHAKDPRNAVVEGLLAQAIVTQKKIEKGIGDETLL